MANYATVTTLIQSVRRRMNLVGLTTINDTELKEFLRDSLAQLHEVLTSRWRDYYVVKTTYTLVSNQEGYPLPTDFRAVTAVFYSSSTTSLPRRYQLYPFNLNEWNNQSTADFAINRSPIMYRVMGDISGTAGPLIYFSPVGTLPATDTVELWYVPAFTPPVDDVTSIGIGLPNGWELWVVFDVCCSVATRMQQTEFYQFFSAERKRMEERLLAAASIRDETPQTMTNIYDAGNGPFNRGPY